MRIWHEKLIPILCRQHLLADWRETRYAYFVITEGWKGYSHHPAVRQFENNPNELHRILGIIYREMLSRGYNPKPIPALKPNSMGMYFGQIKEWQNLNQQIEIMKAKNCKCRVDEFKN